MKAVDYQLKLTQSEYLKKSREYKNLEIKKNDQAQFINRDINEKDFALK